MLGVKTTFTITGVRTMHKAYVTSPGNQRNTLSSVKYGYKECTLTMCNIEAQLEAMMGTFNCKLKGKNSEVCIGNWL